MGASVSVFASCVTYDINRNKNMLTVALGLMMIAYLAGVAAYYLVDRTVGGPQSDRVIAPHFTFKTGMPVYTAAGLTKPGSVAADVEYIAFSNYSTINSELYVDSQVSGILWTLAVVYGIATALSAMFPTWNESSTIASTAGIAYTIAQVLIWTAVQTTLMYVFGNNDYAASYLASACVLAQCALYYVNDQESVWHMGKKETYLAAKAANPDSKFEDALGATKSIRTAIAVMGTASATYLFVVTVVYSILRPYGEVTNYNALQAIDGQVPYEFSVIAIVYATSQAVELARFMLTLVARVSNTEGTEFIKFMHGPLVTVIFHSWLLSLWLLYAFLPMKMIAQAGKI